MELSRKKPNPKNRVPEHVEQAVIQLAIDEPALGQLRVSNELHERGAIISASGVRSIWLRHELETFQKRLKALATERNLELPWQVSDSPAHADQAT